MKTPESALALAYWMHMIASTVWIGGLAILTLLVLPASGKSMEPERKPGFLLTIQRRLDLIGWFSLGLLIVSGLIQMSASAQYEGFMAFENRWSVAILIKHLLIGLIIVISALMTWYVLPGIQRAAFRNSKGLAAPELGRLEKLNRLLLWVDLGLGVVVLGLTALARVYA